MLFFTCDHYYNNDDFLNNKKKIKNNLEDNNKDSNEDSNDNECFICLEIYNDLNATVKLKSIVKYSKMCNCDGWIHNYCLDYWCKNKLKCPICKIDIEIDKNFYYFGLYNIDKFIILYFKNNIYIDIIYVSVKLVCIYYVIIYISYILTSLIFDIVIGKNIYNNVYNNIYSY
jgi:hypothetical protein